MGSPFIYSGTFLEGYQMTGSIQDVPGDFSRKSTAFEDYLDEIIHSEKCRPLGVKYE